MTSPDLTVSIVSYCVAERMKPCLSAALAAAPRHELQVIVVDNASTDESADLLREMSERMNFELILNRENLGFAAANNQALRHARGRYFMLLNPDTEVISDGLSKLIEAMDEDTQLGAIGPQLIDEDGQVTASCRRLPNLERTFWHLSYLDKLFPRLPRLRDYMMSDFDHHRSCDVDQPQGAALMLRQSVIEEVGPLDERFFLYYEEVDWCARVLAAGHRIRFLANAQVRHAAGSSADKVWGRAIHHFFESMVRYHRKNHGLWGALSVKGMIVGGAILRIFAWVWLWLRGRLTWAERRRRTRAFLRILWDLPSF
ncbi:MAG: glycosyltransferase family 2 protein [Myxococcota bacterium]|nr:hypothetical protein [Myxococcales bacterium]MEC7751670.1 glycosyltransferase family 2 protein [Myxococcota bacterium]